MADGVQVTSNDAFCGWNRGRERWGCGSTLTEVGVGVMGAESLSQARITSLYDRTRSAGTSVLYLLVACQLKVR